MRSGTFEASQVQPEATIASRIGFHKSQKRHLHSFTCYANRSPSVQVYRPYSPQEADQFSQLLEVISSVPLCH